MALKDFSLLPYPKEAINEGEVFDFEEIAQLSEGAKYLGVLKMDVDYLGLLFGLGIDSPTISRIATLSNNLDLFFGAYLNKICEELTQPENRVRSIFYIVYSGGDDLLIIGPWDKTIELASKIYQEFREYTSNNPNITLSGGIVFVKPHFPVQRFVQLVGEELEKAKCQQRDKITLFDETVDWQQDAQSLDELLNFARQLSNWVKDKDLPMGFIYYLRELKEKHFREEGECLMWIPHFRYSLVRRIKDKEVRAEIQEKVTSKIMRKIKIPVSYVSLKERKG
jgi:CRISPR-associated protein Csm1